jgi:hypothetical protein
MLDAPFSIIYRIGVDGYKPAQARRLAHVSFHGGTCNQCRQANALYFQGRAEYRAHIRCHLQPIFC